MFAQACVSQYLGIEDFLTITTPWANSVNDKLIIFFLQFSQKTGFDILCKLSPSVSWGKY